MLQEGGIMEKQLAECLAENRIYTLYEGGITMLRKLFNGRRKFVTLGALVVLLGSVGIWIWAQMGVGTVPLRVTALDAELSSIKVPIAGEWKDTGPIKISLADSTTQFPVGQLDPRTKRATIVWPVSISAPLLKELGLEKVDTFLVGVAERFPNNVGILTIDFTVIDIPGIPSIIVANSNGCIICIVILGQDKEAFWRGEPGSEFRGKFDLSAEAFPEADVRRLQQEAFAMASRFMHFPVANVDVFLNTAIRLQRENMHEIVVYIPEYNSYQTADLRGTYTLRVGR
jgi:hypothetical protein